MIKQSKENKWRNMPSSALGVRWEEHESKGKAGVMVRLIPPDAYIFIGYYIYQGPLFCSFIKHIVSCKPRPIHSSRTVFVLIFRRRGVLFVPFTFQD